jgi:ABC-type sugar transport system ATPase subunit
MTPVLRIRSISKSFPGVKALQDVSFEVTAGSVHAVMGENGAGKSTLMQIVSGILRPDTGSLSFEGQELRHQNTRDAADHGIAIVFQELNLVPTLSIAENIFLGCEPRHRGMFVDTKTLQAKTSRILDRLGLALDPDSLVSDLTIAQQQLIEICKSLVNEPRLLILDEPTSSLSEAETTVLFRVIADLRASGVTILYISHRMREVFEICDVVTILRDGKHVKTMRLCETDQDEIVRLMVGRDLAGMQRRKPSSDNKPIVLSIRGLTEEPHYRDISFDLRSGEIVGLAGLVGAGRSEMALGLFGAPPAKEGKIMIDGRAVRISKPREAMQLGLGLVPEDRKLQGLFLGRAVDENISIAALDSLSRHGFINFGSERKMVDRYVSRFKIKTPGVNQLIGLLSGGNQQKAVLAKWLATSPRVLIVDEPTRGIDVGTKAEIYALMRQLADDGLAILVISSDLPEVLTLSERILVMRAGHLVGEVSFEEATEERVMALAALEHASHFDNASESKLKAANLMESDTP